jgi:hypothetical protein
MSETPYAIAASDGKKKSVLMLTDDRERAVTCAKALARSWQDVEVRYDGKSYFYPNLEELK